eukprot:Sspe_Gene.16829::Locus_5950_Transcript_1_1_Confidence_1.000_Length_5035::g.16829::m.16829/K13026/DHX57; ATP-dependent RNA helicase DHX57
MAGVAELPPLAELFSGNGTSGEIAASDIDDVLLRHEQSTAGLQMKHELRIPIEAKGKQIISDALKQYTAQPPNDEAVLPRIGVLLPYVAPTDYTPTSSVAFLQAKQRSSHQRQGLQVYRQRQEIVQSIQNNSITVVSGPLRSGKSTQVPELVLDMELFHRMRIMMIEPTPLACVSVAGKMAQDLGTQVGGNVVGYAAPLDACVQQSSQLVVMTAGMALRHLHHDNDISDVGCVIIDEWQARDAEGEVLLTLLRELVRKRENLRVVVLVDSSTDGAKAVNDLCSEEDITTTLVTIPVEVTNTPQLFLEEAISWAARPSTPLTGQVAANLGLQPTPQGLASSDPSINQRIETIANASFRLSEWRETFLALIADLVSAYLQMCDGTPKGKICIFLPSWGHMKAVAEELSLRSVTLPIVPVHEGQPQEAVPRSALLHHIFSRQPCILLTAGSSLTCLAVNDADFIIDSSREMPFNFDAAAGMNCADITYVDQSTIALRHMVAQAGGSLCVHLIPRIHYPKLLPTPRPAIRSSDLRPVLLHLKAISRRLNVQRILRSGVERANDRMVEQAFDLLKQANLIGAKDSHATAMGKFCAYIPVPIPIAKMLFYGVAFRCLDSVLTIAASMLAPPLFSYDPDTDEDATKSKIMFSQDSESDLIAALKAYLTVEQAKESEESFCKHSNLSYQTVVAIRRIRGVLLDLLMELKVFRSEDWKAANLNMKKTSLIKTCITSALYPNVALQMGGGNDCNLAIARRLHQSVQPLALVLHPSSVGRKRTNPIPSFTAFQHYYYCSDDEPGQALVQGQRPAKRIASISTTTSVEPLNMILFCGSGTATMLEDAKTQKRMCRGWYPPEPTCAWARTQSAMYTTREAAASRDPNRPPDRSGPVILRPASYNTEPKVEVVLDQRIHLVSDKSVAELAVNFKKAVLSLTTQRILGLSSPFNPESPGLFPEQLNEMLELLLMRSSNPLSYEHKLRAEYWSQRPPPPPSDTLFPFKPLMNHPIPPPMMMQPAIPGLPAPPLPPNLLHSGVSAPSLPLPPFLGPDIYTGQHPTAAEREVIDRLAQRVFEIGTRDLEDKLKDKPAFAFLLPYHGLHAYYEWKLKQIAAEAGRPPLPPSASAYHEDDEERRRREARKKYLEEQGMTEVQYKSHTPAIHMERPRKQIGFVPRKDLPPELQPQPEPQIGETVYTPFRRSPDAPPRETRIVRRPSTPPKIFSSEDMPQPYTADEYANMEEEDALGAERARLRVELSLVRPGSELIDVTPITPAPKHLLPKSPPNIPPSKLEEPPPRPVTAGAPLAFPAPGMMVPTAQPPLPPGLPPSVQRPIPPSPLAGAGIMGIPPTGLPSAGTSIPPSAIDKEAMVTPAVKRPSVLVGPIPSKDETKGSNLPLILAKALGETLGVKVGPTLIIGREAFIDVPSYGVEEKALKKEFFVCLGKKIFIQKNDKIALPQKAFLAARLENVRKRVNAGYNRGRERSFSPGRKGGRKGGWEDRDHDWDRGRGRRRRSRSFSDERPRIEDRRGYSPGRRTPPRRSPYRRTPPRRTPPRRTPSPHRRRRSWTPDHDRKRRRSLEDRRRRTPDYDDRPPLPPPSNTPPPAPLKSTAASKPPPAAYKCPKCKEGGHWVKDCPTLKK